MTRAACALLCLLAASTALAQAAPRKPSARPAYAASGADQRRTGRSSGLAPKDKPKLLWTARLSARGLVPPAVLRSGLLLVGSRSGLHALDPASGAERWFADIGPVRYTPAVLPSDEVIAIGGTRAYRVDGDGRARSLAPELKAARAAPLLEGERIVLIGSFAEGAERDAGPSALAPSSRPPSAPAPEQLVALSVDGEVLSATALGIEHPRLLASIAPGLAVAAGRDSLMSRAPTDGFGSRVIDLGDAVSALVVGDGEETIAITESDQLIILEASGAERRVTPGEPRAVTNGPALGRDGGLRIGLESGEILSLSPDGSERWRRGLDGRPGPILLDQTDTALFATSRGTLYAIDAGGELRWLLSADALRAGRPVLGSDGTLYIVFRGGLIAAYR
jgi:outer membrane protein assembly factor BamB